MKQLNPLTMKTINFIKSYFLYLIFFLLSLPVFSQIHDTNNAPFIGTWEYQNGNQIFRLIIWEETEPNPYDGNYYLSGHYEMVEVNNNIETTLYTSNPPDIPNNRKFPNAFSGTVMNGAYIGTFQELHNNGSGLNGDFKIVYSFPPQKISFAVTKWSGVQAYPTGTTPPTGFVVPNNIILTKKP